MFLFFSYCYFEKVFKADFTSVKCFFFLLFTDVCLSCTICRCDYEEDETVFELPCSHLFHPQCVTTWLKMVIRILLFKSSSESVKQTGRNAPLYAQKRAPIGVKGEKNWPGQKKQSESEASREVVWGGERVAEPLPPFPPPQATSRLLLLFPQMRSLVPG